MDKLRLAKRTRSSGVINLPGSKSVSNRALLLAALASGATRITNLLRSDDTERMLESLRALGVQTEIQDKATECLVTGLSSTFKAASPLKLFLGNAGTAMRPLVAVLAASEGEFEMTGEPRMEERPLGPLLTALRSAGADIACLKNEGYPPLRIRGRKLSGGVLEIDGTVSSQFITAVLMAAPLMEQAVTLKIRGNLISKPYIDITVDLMEKFGVHVENRSYQEFHIPAGQHYVSPGEFLVEGDASGASYFLAMGAIAGSVRVTGVGRGSVQGDVAFTRVLEAMGAKVTMGEGYIECSQADLHGIDMDMNDIPDAAMTAVPLALYADSPTVIRNVGSWRVKETDRLTAMENELKKLGIKCETGPDWIRICPGPVVSGAAIDTYNDHRMAMCFSLVSFLTDVVINDPRCVAKTFPDYFERFAEIAG